jgi:hydroxymethylbilane synthase
MNSILRIGTRGSQLALWQANEVARKLGERGVRTEIVPIRTSGDRFENVSLTAIGGKGLFVKELEEALASREIDIAVHSLKDVPSIIPDDFVLAGFLERADPRDAWLQPDGRPIDALTRGATIGTSAPRRRAQLQLRYPHLRFFEIRGNVDTRIAKMQEGQCTGLVLAAAGLTRLGRAPQIVHYFNVSDIVPAAGQGIITIETLRPQDFARNAAASISDHASELAARCERGLLQQFGDRLDCTSPIGVHASGPDDDITLRVFLSDYEGTKPLRITRRGSDPDALVRTVAREMMDLGAMELVGVCVG